MTGQRGTGLRIFIEPSGFGWLNLGDALMLETALRRIRSFWPDASITVHCDDPESLARVDARAVALAPWGGWGWSADSVRRADSRLLDPLRRHAPRTMRMLAYGAMHVVQRDPQLVDRYLTTVRRSHLTLVTGAGFFNDHFTARSFVALESLELAMNAGGTAALVGQGLGPIQHLPLRRRAAHVLRRVDLIALREAVAGRPLLSSFGVPDDRIVVTGDDAVETAYDARPRELGAAMGFNVRHANYAGIDDALMRAAGETVREALRARNAALVPIAISRHDRENDLRVTCAVAGHPASGRELVTTSDLLRATAECRVVVTGSYHAGVIALSMGIPAVCIAGSAYYVDKFRGLAAQFGEGCRVEVAAGPDFGDRLSSAIDDAWTRAEEVRPMLLDAASRQIEAGRAAYQRLADLVSVRVSATSTGTG